MRISPPVTLGLSAAFGLAAILVARYYMMPGDMEPTASAELPQEVLVPVVVAATAIERGETVDGLNLVVEKWPEDEAPFGRFASIEAVGSTQYSTRRTLSAFSEGDPILDSRLSPLGQRASLAGRIPPGYRAFTIRTSAVTGVAGFILPGDRVDILVTKDTMPGSETVKPMAEVLLQNIEVLGVDLNDDLRSDQPSEFKTATLAVTLEDAQKLSAAGDVAMLSMALRGTRDTEIVDVVDEAPQRVASAPAPARRVVYRQPPQPRFGTVEVVLGEAKQDVTVPKLDQQ